MPQRGHAASETGTSLRHFGHSTVPDDTAKVFPRAKVFLHRYFCEDFGDKVTYSNVNEKSGFVAVYAGDTAAAAAPILALAKASGYPDANIRRLEVIVVYQIE